MYLTQSLHRNLQLDPDGVCTVYGGRTRTWSESADRVVRLAAGLKSLGVAQGDRVAILSLNSDRYHEYLLATWPTTSPTSSNMPSTQCPTTPP